MGTYATIDELKSASLNIPEIRDGTDEDISVWAHQAWVYINNYCRQNFDFEQQVTRNIRFSYNPTVFLPKVISGEVSVQSVREGGTPTPVVARLLEWEPDTYRLRYTVRNRYDSDPNPALLQLLVTADWGYAASSEQLLVLFANSLKTKYSAHAASSVFHLTPDVANVVTADDATDLASACDLLNDLKTQFSAHRVSTVVHSVAATGSIVSGDATDEASAMLLAGELRALYHVHIASTAQHLVADSNVVKASLTNTILPHEIKLAFIKVTQRIALRDNAEDLRYMNSGFTSESFSDGYSYSLSDAQLRSVIHPNDEVLLSEHRNEGQVAY